MKRQILLILSVIFILSSCSKDELDDHKPSSDELDDHKLSSYDLQIDTVRLLEPTSPNNTTIFTFNYDSEGNLSQMKKFIHWKVDIDDYKEEDDIKFEKENGKLIITEEIILRDSNFTRINICPLNSNGNVVYDSSDHSEKLYNEEGYLIKEEYNIVSIVNSIEEGNIIKKMVLWHDDHHVSDNSTFIYNYEYYDTNNYLNNAFYFIDISPVSFFLGKTTKKLIHLIKPDDNNTDSKVAQRFNYTFDNKGRVIEVLKEERYSNIDWYPGQRIQLIYKNK